MKMRRLMNLSVIAILSTLAMAGCVDERPGRWSDHSPRHDRAGRHGHNRHARDGNRPDGNRPGDRDRSDREGRDGPPMSRPSSGR